MSKKFGLHALLLLLSIGLFVGVRAQSSTAGNITGTVRDQQGSAVANAEITITEEKTGASRTARTNDDGFYNAPGLPPWSLHDQHRAFRVQENSRQRC